MKARWVEEDALVRRVAIAKGLLDVVNAFEAIVEFVARFTVKTAFLEDESKALCH